MAIHPKLITFSKVRNIRAFNNYLQGIQRELEKLGAIDFDVEVISSGSSKWSLFRRIIGRGFSEAESVLLVRAEVHGCQVEIQLYMSERRTAMPYFIIVELPVPMKGRAEYRRGTFGSNWYFEPKDKSRIAGLQRSLPKVKMIQDHAINSKGIIYKIERGHLLEPTKNDKTRWIVQTGYEGGFWTGGNRPRILKYLEAIPTVKALLQKWKDS